MTICFNKLSATEQEEIIPELKLWHQQGMDLRSFLVSHASPDKFISYSEMFWPEFLEFDDCIFFADGFSEKGYHEWRRQLDKKQTEAMLNHRHIHDFFLNAEQKPTRAATIFIGRLLKEIWSVKLSHEFPERKFVVSFPEDYSDQLIDYEVSFFQESQE
jgi:hypothetical protein